MLYLFGFDRLGIAIADQYFSEPGPSRLGDERGVRVELRVLETAQPRSAYAARAVTVDRPLWRVDLLESVAGPGSFDPSTTTRGSPTGSPAKTPSMTT
jgi:hypothetical protein